MRIIIFSDTHLSNHFDQRLYDQLQAISNKADIVIINGDFWDRYLTTFDAFIQSPWQKLFPSLQKKTFYLYGNHDLKEWSDNRINYFSIWQGERLSFFHGEHYYHVQHGHRLMKHDLDIFASILPLTVSQSIYTWLKKQEGQDTLIGRYITKKAAYYDEKGDAIFRGLLPRFSKKNHRHILGHSHLPHFKQSGNYFNPGRFPGYIEIDEKGISIH